MAKTGVACGWHKNANNLLLKYRNRFFKIEICDYKYYYYAKNKKLVFLRIFFEIENPHCP